MTRTLALLAALLFTSYAQAQEITICAASSLTDALKEVGAAYQSLSGDKLTFNFAASSVLARQIEEGAPADIFFSADDAQMDRLEKGGHIAPGSRHELLSNTLVIIAPAESTLSLHAAADLRQVQRIAVGDPKLVPVGVYTRKYLEQAGLWNALKPRIVPTENVRAGLAVVESGNADVAFVYATDTRISKKVKIVLRTAGAEVPPILYPIAVVQESERKPEAARFLAYLSGDAARKVFQKYGFIVKP